MLATKYSVVFALLIGLVAVHARDAEKCSSEAIEVVLVPGEGEDETDLTWILQSENKGFNEDYYQSNSDCKWNVKPAPGKRVKIDAENLGNFELETSEGCWKDYVSIAKGQNVVKCWCGKNTKDPVAYIGEVDEVIGVNFKSDRAGNHKGFILHVTNGEETEDPRLCGEDRVLTATDTVFEINLKKGDGSNYENNLWCEFNVETTEEQGHIKLEWQGPIEKCGKEAVEEGEEDDCSCDYVEINDKKYCDNNKTFEKFDKNVTIKFSSDGSVSHPAKILKAEYVPPPTKD